MRNAVRGRRNRGAWLEDLARQLRLNGDQWHDGRLAALSIQASARGRIVRVTLRVDVYGEGERVARRAPLTVTFGGVREVTTTLNCRELADTGDDHIVFARLSETSVTLDLGIHLAAGHVRIVAERFAVATRVARRRRAP